MNLGSGGVSSNQGLFLLGHAGGAGGGVGGDILTMNMIIQTTDTKFRSKEETTTTHPDNCCNVCFFIHERWHTNINDVDKSVNNNKL